MTATRLAGLALLGQVPGVVLGGEVGPDTLGALLPVPLGPILAGCSPAQWQIASISTGLGAYAATGAGDYQLQSLLLYCSASAMKASEMHTQVDLQLCL